MENRMGQDRPQINVRVAGEGAPALVFVHGFGCALDDWTAQLADLASDFRCIALDLPGHGASAVPPEASLQALGAAVNTVRDEQGAGAAILIGHSLGAKVIREAYWQASADVAGLILIDGAYYDGDRDVLIGRAAAAIDEAGFTAYARRHFADMFLPGSDPAMRDHVLARTLELDPEFGRALYLQAVGWDPLRGQETLRRISVPTLVLQATDLDSRFTRRMLDEGDVTPFMRMVTDLVPGAQARVIPGSGHFPMADAAAAVNAAIRTFAKHVAPA